MPPNPEVVLVDDVAPVEVEAEALLVLVQRGPQAAAAWLTDCLRRARWTNVLHFEWWPAHAVLALMDLREGRVGRARARAAAEYLPDHVSVLVEADAALVEGSAVECLDLLARYLVGGCRRGMPVAGPAVVGMMSCPCLE